jgi:hypothetical protein
MALAPPPLFSMIRQKYMNTSTTKVLIDGIRYIVIPMRSILSN